MRSVKEKKLVTLLPSVKETKVAYGMARACYIEWKIHALRI